MLDKRNCLAYDDLVKKYQSHIYPLIFSNLVNDMKYNTYDNLKVLELGTGNGYFSNQFFKKTNFQINSIDINEIMISIAKTNFPENKVNYIIDDAHTLSKFDDASQDLIVSYSCFHHWINPAIVLKTCLKKLRINGTIVIFDTRPLNYEEQNILKLKIIEEEQRGLLLKASKEAWTIEDVREFVTNELKDTHFTLNYFEPTAIDVASSIDELDTMKRWENINIKPTLWRLVIKKEN